MNRWNSVLIPAVQKNMANYREPCVGVGAHRTDNFCNNSRQINHNFRTRLREATSS
jgi:hypothetical protein